MNGRLHLTTQAQFTSSGVWFPSKSCPDKRWPFSKRSVSRAPRPIGLIPRSAPDFRSDSQTHDPSADVGKSSNPASPVYPVRVTRNEARPLATEGSRAAGVAVSGGSDFPHPSISGGTARGWAPHGAGGGILEEDLAHVSEGKKSDRLADGEMFVDDSGILEGHLPSAELDEARARGTMPFVERSARRHAGRQRARR